MDAPTRPLRIAITLEQCWHRVPGGTARAALELVDALVELGGTPDGGHRRRLELVGVSARHRHPAPAPWTPGIGVAQLPLPRRLLYESWHALGRPKVQVATGPVDVIHATGLAMPPPTAPLVATLHDLAFLRAPEHFTRNGLHFFRAALDRMRRDAQRVLCSSEATRADAVEAGFDPARLTVVPLGIRPEPAPPAAAIAEVRTRHGLPERYVLQLGTAEPRKNRIGLLRAARCLPADVAIVFAGAPGWGDEAVDASAVRVVHSLGFVSESDKRALLAGASVFCYPSHWEGFGLPVLEAMALGTPVVTSADTAMAEVCGDGALLVDPADPDSIGAALRLVLDDPDVTVKLRSAGPRIAARYPWSRTAAATARAYAEVAAA